MRHGWQTSTPSLTSAGTTDRRYPMGIILRPGKPGDAAACGQICYDAFRTINAAHNFPPDFPSPEVSIGLLSEMLAQPGFYMVVAERDGVIVGSNGVDE